MRHALPMGIVRALVGAAVVCASIALAPAARGAEAGGGEAAASTEALAIGVPDAAGSREARPIGGAGALRDRKGASSAPAPGQSGWLLRSAGGLAVVLVLAFGLRFAIGKVGGRGGSIRSQLGASGRAPSGVLEVLGRYPVSRGQSLVLLRMDRRVLLLSQSSSGFRTLSEVEDAESVASIITRTNDDAGQSMTARFNDLLRQVNATVGASAQPHQAARAEAARKGDPRGRAVTTALQQIKGVRA